MSEEHEDIQKLLRLKRYERPPEGYFEDFLTEFQSRQRSELLKRSAHSLFFERLATYFSQFSRPQLAGAATAACAAIVLAVVMLGGGPTPDAPGVAGGPEAKPNTELAKPSIPAEFIANEQFMFSEDFQQSPNRIGVVAAEGPFSDLYILHPSGSSHSALFRDF